MEFIIRPAKAGDAEKHRYSAALISDGNEENIVIYIQEKL